MDRPRPEVVPLASVPVIPAADAPTKVRIARLVTRERCGSNLLLGACWMDPGDETNTWSSRETDDVAEGDHWYGPVHETYFIVRGHLRIWWDDGEADLRADDAFYLAPGHTYRLANVGDEPAFFVYGMVPTPE
jgi:mannose-6-phosphate isomerase-like protein (cupin superfamily)